VPGAIRAARRGKAVTTSDSSQKLHSDDLQATVHARQIAEIQLDEPLEMLRSVESLATVGHWVADPQSSHVTWSSGLYALTGLPEGSVSCAEDGRIHILEEDLPHYLVARTQVDGAILEYRWKHPDGSIRWLRSRMRRQPGADGRLVDFGVVQDITTERTTVLALRKKLDLIQAITTQTPGLIFQMRRKRDGTIEFPFASAASKDIYGLDPDALMADPAQISAMHHPDDLEELVATLAQSARTLAPWRHEYRLQAVDGSIKWLRGEAVPEREADGSILWNGFIADITEQRRAQEEIQRLAFFDVLTGLPNRRLLVDRLERTLALADRADCWGALFFIDLDNFKDLNDTLGHDVGDLLLKQVAARIVAAVRGADTVARFGGDEFVVLLGGLGSDADTVATHAEAVARKILASLNQLYEVNGRAQHSTPSVGVALFENRQSSVDELLKRADLAMYQAKAAGRNTVRFYDPAMQAVVAARAALESDLRLALQRNELRLYYQSVVDDSGTVIGAEALARWLHPERGMVSPGEFIPLAEQTGLILPVGQWVLQTACAQLVAWGADATTADLYVAVNVSARQFRQADFVDQIKHILHASGANPHLLKLELTESLLVSDVDDAIDKMADLRSVGVGFSLDDFGTGYSSLAYLKRLPLEQLKIDQSFVRDVLEDPNDAAIARTIITLAHSLGLKVVAEGVETIGQRDFLLRHGCSLFQGFLFGRPAPAGQFNPALAHAGMRALLFEI
jgi:diguanylate cyclase (GGDEF)-like protein/PAS domain S-box-containing protein